MNRCLPGKETISLVPHRIYCELLSAPPHLLPADILVLLPDVCHRHAVDDLSECGGLLLPPFVLPTFPHHIQLREFRGVFVFLHLRRPRLDSAGLEEVESFQSTPRCASFRRRGTRDPHGGNNFLTPDSGR